MNFPAEFFQDEYRCGFLVPELMKRAWATEIEILEVVTREFDTLKCKKVPQSLEIGLFFCQIFIFII